MSPTYAILAGAVIIAGSLFFSQAKAGMGGPYQLMQHSNPNASVGVFRIDTSSGDVSYCFLNKNNTLACSDPVK